MKQRTKQEEKMWEKVMMEFRRTKWGHIKAKLLKDKELAMIEAEVQRRLAERRERLRERRAQKNMP